MEIVRFQTFARALFSSESDKVCGFDDMFLQMLKLSFLQKSSLGCQYIQII